MKLVFCTYCRKCNNGYHPMYEKPISASVFGLPPFSFISNKTVIQCNCTSLSGQATSESCRACIQPRSRWLSRRGSWRSTIALWKVYIFKKDTCMLMYRSLMAMLTWAWNNPQILALTSEAWPQSITTIDMVSWKESQSKSQTTLALSIHWMFTLGLCY